MGLDLTIISNHELDEDLEKSKEKVLNKLNFEYNDSNLRDYFISATNAYSFKEWNKNSWKYDLMGKNSLKEAVRNDNCLFFKGPWAISIILGFKSYQINFNLRWYHFLESEELQNGVINLMEKMNQVFGSEYNIYIPDNGTQSSAYSDLVTNSFNLDEILTKMKNEIGKPCKTVEELASKFKNNENAYLII